MFLCMTPARRRLVLKAWARIKDAIVIAVMIVIAGGVWVACVVGFIRLVTWAAR